MAEDDETKAALELTILSVELEGLKTKCATTTTSSTSSSLWKTRTTALYYYAVAWLDPALKQSTRRLPTGNPDPNPNSSAHQKIYFPLTPQTLNDPDGSCVTIEVLSPSRFPLHGPKLIGSASLPLSSLRISAETLALTLWRPSGRARGSVLLCARVFWDLGFLPPPPPPPPPPLGDGCATGVPVAAHDCSEPVFVGPTAPPLPEGSEPGFVGPTAPPLPEGSEPRFVGPTAPPLPEGSEPGFVGPTAPPLPEGLEPGIASPTVPPPPEGSEPGFVGPTAAPPEGSEDKWNAWMGLIGGAVAAVLLGVGCRALRVKS